MLSSMALLTLPDWNNSKNTITVLQIQMENGIEEKGQVRGTSLMFKYARCTGAVQCWQPCPRAGPPQAREASRAGLWVTLAGPEACKERTGNQAGGVNVESGMDNKWHRP